MLPFGAIYIRVHPHKNYFEWQTENGNGYAAEVSYDEMEGKLLLEHIMGLNEFLNTKMRNID